MNLGALFTVGGYAVGIAVFWLVARAKGMAVTNVAILVGAAFGAGIIGAKVVQAMVQGQPSAALDPTAGGRAVFAGIVAGWIAVEVAKRGLGVRTSTGDAFAFALPAGEAVGRVGCFFNGCCYGSESSVPWAVVQHGAARHPAQIYASLAALTVLGVVVLVAKRSPYPGALFHLYLALWGATRFGLEFFRERTPLVLGLDLMQIVALETLFFGVAAIAMLTYRRKSIDTTT